MFMKKGKGLHYFYSKIFSFTLVIINSCDKIYTKCAPYITREREREYILLLFKSHAISPK